MTVAHQDSDGSIIVPALMIVLGAFVAFLLWQQRTTQTRQAAEQAGQAAAIKQLDKTDRIACSFFLADATTQSKKATNAAKSGDKTSVFIGKTGAFIAQINKAEAKQPARRAAIEPFRLYLVAQLAVSRAQLKSTRKNIVLTRAVAAKAQRLAKQLHC